MKLTPTPFKLSALALFAALTMSQTAFANTDLPECPYMQGKPFYANPHCRINYTPEVEAKYNGEGVKLAVVDTGFILSHDTLREQNIHPLTFTLRNPIANRDDSFDPRVDYTMERPISPTQTITTWANHGGAVSAIIVGKSQAYPASYGYNYEGGIAKKAELYVASTRALDQSGNENATDSEVSDIYSKPMGSYFSYYLARLAGGLNKALEAQPFAINISANVDPDFSTEQEVDAKFKGKITAFSQDPFIQAVKKTVEQDRLLVVATGNEQMPQPGVFALLPRYFEGLDKHMIAATALPINVSTDVFPLADFPNKCGVAKQWCITAPGAFLVSVLRGADQSPPQKISKQTEDIGTSFAAPVVTGSLAVLKQRFNYFKPTQVRDTLFTTATDIGDTGIDAVYGWGLVNLERGIKGPMQLLNDETYTVTQDDQWENPLNANQHTLTKAGANRLELRGVNRLAEVAITQGNLVLTGETEASGIQNSATLTLNTRLNAPIRGTMRSNTQINANGHWIVPTDTTVGSVTMEEGAQITLNPRNALAGGSGSTETFNTLTINQNLSGNGIFNYLTNLQNWVGDKVLVNGVASGNFKLNVANSGTEPTDSNRLTLLELRHGAQDPAAVNVSLVRPVDFGAYRYELLKTDGNIYRLYNPRKEKELSDAAVEAERRRVAQEEAARQEQARQLAEAQRQAAERQTQLAAETLAKETAQRERDEARRTLATQTAALQSAEALAQSQTALLEQAQSQLTAEREAKTAALQAAEALRASLSAETEAKQAAQNAENLANQAKQAADSEKAAALKQAEAALAEAARKAEEARQAAQRAQEAERLKDLAQGELANANQQLETQREAVAQAQAQKAAADEALARQTEALTAAQQAREQADSALQVANSEKAQALAAAQTANRLAEEKGNEAAQAQQQVAAKSRELDQLNDQLTSLRQAQQTLAEEKARLLSEKATADSTNATLTTNNAALQAELARVRETLNEAQTNLTQKTQEAEQARQAQAKAEADKAAADALAQAAEQAKADAQAQAQQADEARSRVEQAAAVAEEQARLAAAAQANAEREKADAVAATAVAEAARAQAEQAANALTAAKADIEARQQQTQAALAQAEQALQAERQARERLEAAKQQLESAQNGTEADLTSARTALAEAQAALTAKTQEATAARLAQQQAESAQAAARLAETAAQQALRQAENDKAGALAALARAEQEATAARLAQTEAETARLTAQQAAQQAEAEKAQAQAAQAKAEADQRAAEARAAQAALAQATAEADNARIAQANQALSQANAELELALNAEQTARRKAEEANAILTSSQHGTAADLASARLALAEAEQQAAQKAAESANAQAQADAARQALQQATQDKATAEAQARLAEQAQAAAEQAKRQADELAQQAQAQVAVLTEAKNQAELAQANAMLSATQAQAAQLRAEQAQADAERALASEQLARRQAEAAKAALEASLNQSESARQAAQAALADAEQALALASAESVAKQAEADTAKRLAAEAITAQQQAEQAAQAAQTAQQNAETAKQTAESEKAQAEADKATAEAEKAQAEQTANAATEALNAEKQQAAQAAQQRQQAELISRYSNSALSERAAQVNVLEQLSHSLHSHLFDNNRKLAVWAEYDKQHSNQASEHYRRFEQDSELKQVAVSVPFGDNDQLSVGVVASDIRSTGKFDDNARYHSTTKMVSGLVRLNIDDTVFAEMDIGSGSSQNHIDLEAEKAKFKRRLTTAGVRVGYSAEAFGVKVQPSVGLRYHQLGALNYRLAEAEVQSRQLNIAGLQAGIRVEKAWQLDRFTLAPYYAAYYSDMDSQHHDLSVNGNGLTQQFGRHYRHEIGLTAQHTQWHLDAKAGTVSGNDAMKQRYAGVKVKYQW